MLDTADATYRYFELYRQQLFDSANDETLYKQLRAAESSFPHEGEYPRWLSGLYSDSGMLDSAVACMKRAVAFLKPLLSQIPARSLRRATGRP